MFPKINPTNTQAWLLLKRHYDEEMQRMHMRKLFESDANRFNKFSLRFGDILFDYSKNIINNKTLQLLFQLAEECEVKAGISAMFSGETINETENRAVLHVALRNFSPRSYFSEGKDVMPDVERVREQMKAFCEKVHAEEWKGYTGKPIKSIVNIGIGGSDLGPFMVTEALKPYWKDGITPFFVSNIDGTHISEVLKKVNLYDRRWSSFKSFSLGMKQRLAIGAALLGSPTVLVLDEPTNGLDPVGIAEIRKLIVELKDKGHTIIMASHLLDEVEKVCTHAAILKTGNLIMTGDVAEIMMDEDIVELSAANIKGLLTILKNMGKEVVLDDKANTVQIIFPKGEAKMEEINQHCFNNGVVLTQLVLRKKRLEARFFELTNN